MGSGHISLYKKLPDCVQLPKSTGSTPSPTPGLLNVSHPDGVRWCLPVAVICISLTANDLFMD